MSSNFEITKTCELCGSSFIARKLTTQDCSHQCSQRAYKLRKRDERIKAVVDNETVNLTSTKNTSNQFNPIQNDSTSLNRKWFLNVLEASELLGVFPKQEI